MIHLEKKTIAELGLRAAEKYRRRKAFEIYGDGDVYNKVSFEGFGLRMRQFAALLDSLGLRRGDRVMILSENRPEWALAYFGTALAGMTVVPVLTEFPAEHIAVIADHAGAAALWVSGKCIPKLRDAGLAPDVPVIRLDSLRPEDGPGGSIRVSIRGKEKALPLRKPGSGGLRVSAFPETAEEDLAAIIYTSGTTGFSKGVKLSHRSLIFTVLA
ncbi:MAG: long-chain fatty acid--CoA ligase, partial [Spirochaetaceae bacterium]|nr:long-chain fatty acid--CoA ligase [Spirochaetaceae bacterium]